MPGTLALGALLTTGCSEGDPGDDANLRGTWDVTATTTGGQQLTCVNLGVH